MSDEIDALKDDEKQKLDAAEAAAAGSDDGPLSSERSGNSNWVAGVILIALGAFFLLSNLTGWSLDNWWAIFILIPAFGSFGRAWADYRQHGHLTAAARGPLIGGFLLTFVAAVFLFELDWGRIWPVFLILGGVAALLGNWFGDR